MIARAFPRASGKWSTRSGLQSFIDPDTKFVTIREPAFNCLVSAGWSSPFCVNHADDSAAAIDFVAADESNETRHACLFGIHVRLRDPLRIDVHADARRAVLPGRQDRDPAVAAAQVVDNVPAGDAREIQHPFRDLDRDELKMWRNFRKRLDLRGVLSALAEDFSDAGESDDRRVPR